MAEPTLSFRFRVERDDRWHDAHFPGQPIVPGAVLLDATICAYRQHSGAGPLRRLARVRFLNSVTAPIDLEALVTQGSAVAHCIVRCTTTTGSTKVLEGDFSFAP